MYGTRRDGRGRPDRRARPARASCSSPPRSGPAAATRASARWRPRSGACASSAMDLMQVHNLVDVATHTKTLREMKSAGQGSATSASPTTPSRPTPSRALAEDRAVRLPADQLLARASARRRARSCRCAQERSVAVIVNRPFAEGALFGKVEGQAAAGLGGGARHRRAGRSTSSSGSCRTRRSPAPFPAPARPSTCSDNLAPPGFDPPPDAAARTKMPEYFDSL